jgi:hypothetical protein
MNTIPELHRGIKGRVSIYVRLGLTQDLAGDRRDIPMPGEHAADQVEQRVAISGSFRVLSRGKEPGASAGSDIRKPLQELGTLTGAFWRRW